MKRKHYSEEKITSILKEHEAEASVPDTARRHGVTDSLHTESRWQATTTGYPESSGSNRATRRAQGDGTDLGKRLSSISYRLRPERSVHRGIRAAKYQLQDSTYEVRRWVIEGDLASYFEEAAPVFEARL